MKAEHGITCDCGQTFSTVAGLQPHLNSHAPATLYAILDPSVPEGEDIADDCETLFGVPYLVEEFDADTRCEYCRRTGAYRIKDEMCGGALCRFHLSRQPMVVAIVESREEVKQFRLPEGPVRMGE